MSNLVATPEAAPATKLSRPLDLMDEQYDVGVASVLVYMYV